MGKVSTKNAPFRSGRLPQAPGRGILSPHMNIEFHYYALFYLARNAGFDAPEALTIAISSQLVDECLSPWEIGPGGESGRTEVTQNYLFWNEDVGRNVYRPFHFIPGEREKAALRRIDGKPGRWTVTADSPLAKEILIAALKTGSLFRIGIALHAYADTWAHQNFSSEQEEQNSLGRLGLPPIGHLQALGSPDDPRRSWLDPRLKEAYCSVNNTERCAAAAGKIYRFLKTYRRAGFMDEDLVVGKLVELWRKGSSWDMSARASDYIVDLDVPPYIPEFWVREAGGIPSGTFGRGSAPTPTGYDRSSWLSRTAVKAESTLGASRGSIEERRYFNSLFARWNEAAREHRRFCLELFSQRGIA